MAKVTQLDFQHRLNLYKLLCIFSSGLMGVTFANIICRIFALLKQHWLWIVAVNAFGMTLDISLWLKIVKMPYCVWPEEHKPTANSPNLEPIIEDDPEDNGNDEKFFGGRAFKTK